MSLINKYELTIAKGMRQMSQEGHSAERKKKQQQRFILKPLFC